jgi:hypothetical protein
MRFVKSKQRYRHAFIRNTNKCSVIALAKLYDLKDPRLAEIQVKGELVPNTDGRIMTRSRARTSTSTLFLFTSAHD